ncbi:MAG: hypothetical protein AAB426_07430 [Myxococcota bacterium]
MFHHLLMVLLTLTAVAVPLYGAHAQCLDGALRGAASVRVENAVGDRLQGVVSDAISRTIVLPPDTFSAVECPAGGTIAVTIKGGEALLTASTPQVEFVASTVMLHSLLSIDATAAIDVAVCGDAPASCQAHLTAQRVKFSAQASASADDCAPSLSVLEMGLIADPYRTAVTITGCGALGDDLTLVANALQVQLLDLLEREVASRAPERITKALDGLAGNFFSTQVESSDMRLDVAVERLRIDAGAMQTDFSIAVTPTVPAASCLPPGTILPPVAPAVPPGPFAQSTSISGVFSQQFLQQLINVAWYVGAFCFTNDELGPSVDRYLGNVFPGLTATASLVPTAAPEIAISGNGVTTTLAIHLPRALVDVIATFPGEESSRWVAQIATTLTLEVVLDPTLRVLTLKPIAATLDDLELLTAEGSPRLDANGLARLIETVAIPQFLDNAAVIPLGGDILAACGLMVRLVNVGSTPGSARLDLDVWPIDHTDQVAPTTSVASDMPAVAAAKFSVDVASIDDATPEEFIRHWVTIDGTQESSPRSGSRMFFGPLAAGLHQVRIRAVDASGNEDVLGIAATVAVDDQPPLVAIDEAPRGEVRKNDVLIRFSAIDDRSPKPALTYRYTVGLVADDLRRDEPLDAGALDAGGTLSLRDVPNAAKVRVTVFARDAVGNEGLSDATFRVTRDTSPFSCQAACGPGSVSLWLALSMLAGVLRHRRSARTTRPRRHPCAS